MKPWGNRDRSRILKIMNSYSRHCDPNYTLELKEDIVHQKFGHIPDSSQELLCFEDATGEVVGYSGLTNDSGGNKEWRVSCGCFPEYFPYFR